MPDVREIIDKNRARAQQLLGRDAERAVVRSELAMRLAQELIVDVVPIIEGKLATGELGKEIQAAIRRVGDTDDELAAAYALLLKVFVGRVSKWLTGKGVDERDAAIRLSAEGKALLEQAQDLENAFSDAPISCPEDAPGSASGMAVWSDTQEGTKAPPEAAEEPAP